MRDIISRFKGYKRIEVDGYNQSFLLTKLADENISIEKVERKSPKSMFFNIKKKQCKKTFAILEKLCYNYSIVGEYGISKFLKSALSRIGLIIGVIIFGTVSIIGENFIWKVEIGGNERTDSLSIERRLEDNGIAVGMVKRKLDAFGVRMLLNDMDGIAESSVEIVGTTLKITVFEDTEFTNPITEPEISLVSKYDARITRIIVDEGTAKVNIGDNISAGTELISGEIFDTNGESLGLRNAKGRVYGIVSFTASTIFSETVMTEKDTGNKEVRSSFEIFGLKIGGKKPVEFRTFRQETKRQFLTENLFFPIKYTRTVYYETCRDIIDNDIDGAIESWKKEKILEMIISCGGSETEAILVKTDIGGNLTKADLFLQAEMPLI